MVDIKNKVKLELTSDIFKEIYRIDEEGIPVFKTFLTGSWVEDQQYSNVKSPIDMSTIARVPKLSFSRIDQAIEILYRIGRWTIRNTPGAKRLKILEKTAELMDKYSEELTQVLVVNAGKPLQAARSEVHGSIERLKEAAFDIRNLRGDYIPGDWSEETLETEALVRREPLGVVLIITPFNYPLFDAVNKIAYTVFSGNAVAIKPASADPIPAILLAKLLEKAGYPPNALAVLTVPGREMGKIVADSRIAAVSLTGSSETGEEVLRQGGIKHYIMELGGGDPVIVMDDADPRYAAERIVRGIYSYSGQRCDAVKLILVEEPVYDEFKKHIVEELAKVKVGDPRDPKTDMGPLIDPSVADEMMKAIEDAKALGGKILYGGKRLGETYVEPTLIEMSKTNVKRAILYWKEVFAPVSLLVKVNDIDEAIELSNGRPYGLDASIFGKDISKIRKAIRLLEVGAVYINDFPRHGIGYYPFGGRKRSGIGREGIGYAIEYITAYKTIVYNYKGAGVWEYF